MTNNEGDKVRNNGTGEVYFVKLVGDRMIVLESEDRLSQVLCTAGILSMYFEPVEIPFPGESQPLSMVPSAFEGVDVTPLKRMTDFSSARQPRKEIHRHSD